MGGEIPTALPAEVGALQQQVIELRRQNSYLSSRAAALEEQLQLLRNKIFGRRSERSSAEDLEQASLFNEEELSPAAEQRPESGVEVAAHRRAKPGRKPLPAGLPREEVVHDIPKEDKTCSCCGAPLVRIDEETSEGYEGYSEVGQLPGIVHVGCSSHTRRKFDEAAKASKNAGSAHEALGRIAKIYRGTCVRRSFPPRNSSKNGRNMSFRFSRISDSGLRRRLRRFPHRYFWAKRLPTR